MRHFCGYCGTPLSYWTEQPPAEARFISLTLGSLVGEDLRELEELGLLLPPSRLEAAAAGTAAADDDDDDDDDDDAAATTAALAVAAAAATSRLPVATMTAGGVGGGSPVDYDSGAAAAAAAAGLPWFEALLEGSRLGRMSSHRRRVQRTDASGSEFSVEWEIVEWTSEAAASGGGDDVDVGSSSGSGAETPAKRKHGELDEGGRGDEKGSGVETASAPRATAEVEMTEG